MRSQTLTTTSKAPPELQKKSELRPYLGQLIRLKNAIPIVIERGPEAMLMAKTADGQLLRILFRGVQPVMGVNVDVIGVVTTVEVLDADTFLTHRDLLNVLNDSVELQVEGAAAAGGSQERDDCCCGRAKVVSQRHSEDTAKAEQYAQRGLGEQPCEKDRKKMSITCEGHQEALISNTSNAPNMSTQSIEQGSSPLNSLRVKSSSTFARDCPPYTGKSDANASNVRLDGQQQQ
ncbi:hypothetical protein BC629DRAFT_1438437 [Irpex lacteus]|nr:hypothetical protein BC629DRAFT_1438437 [Irpex lacteus]